VARQVDVCSLLGLPAVEFANLQQFLMFCSPFLAEVKLKGCGMGPGLKLANVKDAELQWNGLPGASQRQVCDLCARRRINRSVRQYQEVHVTASGVERAHGQRAVKIHPDQCDVILRRFSS